MKRARATTLTAAIVIAASTGLARMAAQTPATSSPRPVFDVVSVKPNKTGETNIQLSLQPGGRFVAVNVPLRQLIQFSYQLQSFQMVGGPDWQTTDRFDIIAKAESDVGPPAPGTIGPAQLMIQSLLADRFKLVVHREMRDMPIYALVVARSDGRLGPKLTVSTVDCDPMRPLAPGTAPPRTADGRPLCGMSTSRGHMMSGGFPVPMLLLWLSQTVQRTVVDRTGLAGNYDADLTFTPDQPARAQSDTQAVVDTSGPSIFTALQEQLGLKLESQRGPVDVLVIDSAERPVAN